MTMDEAKEILISRKNSYLSNTEMAKAIDVAIQALTDSTPTDTARAEDSEMRKVFYSALKYTSDLPINNMKLFRSLCYEMMKTYAAPIRAEVERVRWEKELVMRQLSAANQRIAELSDEVDMLKSQMLSKDIIPLPKHIFKPK